MCIWQGPLSRGIHEGSDRASLSDRHCSNHPRTSPFRIMQGSGTVFKKRTFARLTTRGCQAQWIEDAAKDLSNDCGESRAVGFPAAPNRIGRNSASRSSSVYREACPARQLASGASSFASTSHCNHGFQYAIFQNLLCEIITDRMPCRSRGALADAPARSRVCSFTTTPPIQT